jgi:CDP-diglyceride synthetase
MDTTLAVLTVLAFILLSIAINMLPAIIAHQRKHRNRHTIFTLDLCLTFLGWTFVIGLGGFGFMLVIMAWVALLVWASTLACAEPRRCTEWS